MNAEEINLVELSIKVLFICLIFIYLGVCYPYKHNKTQLDTFHEGETIGMAIEYLNKKVPYKDTIFVHGIFQDPLRSVIAFKFFGRTIAASRIFTDILVIVVNILLFVFIYYLFDKRIIESIIAICLILSLNRFYSLPHRDILLFLWLITIININANIYNLNNKLDRNDYFKFYLIGLISFLAFVYSIDRGYYLMFSNIFLITTLAIFYSNKAFKLFFVNIIGVTTGIILLGFLIDFHYSYFIDFVFLKMPQYKELMDGLIYPFKRGAFLFPVFLISLNLYWLIIRFFTNNLNLRKINKLKAFYQTYFVEIILFILSFVYFRSALGRSDHSHIRYVSLPIFISITYILLNHYIFPLLNLYSKKLYPIISFLSLFICFICLAINVNRMEFKYLWTFPIGISDYEIIPKSYIPTINYLRNSLSDNQYFFTMTSEASWYYFIDKPCPTKFPVVWFAMPPFYQHEIIEQLSKLDVRFIIYNNNHWANRIDGISIHDRLPIVESYIKSHYKFFKKINDNELWVKANRG